jgi:VWFA-related protein
MMLRRISLAGLCGVAIATAFQTPEPQTATFHGGTRLVEVEVVVRGTHGPIPGLTKENFTVLDRGKPQRIDVFRAGPVNSAAAAGTTTPAVPLAPGAVSNRVNRLGEALPNTTVVLFDQLNTRFDLKAYESEGLLKLIRGLGPWDRVAIYALRKNLHVLQDLTDDPAKLLAAVTHLDPGRDLMPANFIETLFDFPTDATGDVEGLSPCAADARTNGEYKHSIMELAETNARVNAAKNDAITMEALRRIVEHLSGMPGRRNLVWLKEDPVMPPAVMGLLLQSNIALYLVQTRSVLFVQRSSCKPDDPSYGTHFMGSAQAFAAALTPGSGVTCLGGLMPDFMDTQRAGRRLAAMTGGAGFDDAGDLQLAVKTAEEDSQSAYTLGYYPPEAVLDGKNHLLTVTVAGEKANQLEVRYRPGCLATKEQASAGALSQPAALAELFANPLDATAIGLAAEPRPDTQPGLYQVRVTVDLHDVHLERKGNRSIGKIEVAFPFGDKSRVRTIGIDLADDRLVEALKTGFVTIVPGVEASGDFIRVGIRDPSTCMAGSLRIPLLK